MARNFFGRSFLSLANLEKDKTSQTLLSVTPNMQQGRLGQERRKGGERMLRKLGAVKNNKVHPGYLLEHLFQVVV